MFVSPQMAAMMGGNFGLMNQMNQIGSIEVSLEDTKEEVTRLMKTENAMVLDVLGSGIARTAREALGKNVLYWTILSKPKFHKKVIRKIKEQNSKLKVAYDRKKSLLKITW